MRANEASAAEQMKRFATYADVYERFEAFSPESREGLFFYRLEQLDSTTAYPLLLEALMQLGSAARRSELLQVLGDLESFFVRRAVCELTAKNYNKLVVELLKHLDSSGGFSADAIRAFLLKGDSEVARWPSDDEFEKAWGELLFYKRLKKKARMVLEALELNLYTGKTEKVIIESGLTMEHLLPRRRPPTNE